MSLALVVSQWNQDRSEKKIARLGLQNIAGEIVENRKVLRIINDANSSLINQSDDEDASDEDKNFIPGLQLRETAWNVLLSTGASNQVEYGALVTLTELYVIQELYKSFGNRLIDSYMMSSTMQILLGNEATSDDIDKQLRENITLLVNIENMLLSNYDSALEDLNTAGIQPLIIVDAEEDTN